MSKKIWIVLQTSAISTIIGSMDESIRINLEVTMKKSILITILLLTLTVLLVSACSNTAGTGEGNALIDERCSTCHSANTVYRADFDEAGWSEVIDDMVEKGAVVSADEKAQMIEWLLAQP
jgi:predicted small secreted protein